MDIIKTIETLGLSTKAAQIYLAALEGGEQTIQQLAKLAGIKRTSAYYTITELIAAGAIIEVRFKKKVYYRAERPSTALKRAKERIGEFEQSLPTIEQHSLAKFKKPSMMILQGNAGFKQIWERILESGDKEFLILTEAINFLDFVQEKYIVEEIEQKKRHLGIKSRQLIKDSFYAKRITSKDRQENRVSKTLPATFTLPYTEIICKNFVAFISPKWENLMMII